MSNRRIAADLLEQIPEDMAHEREFVAGILEGFDQLERGEGVPIEKVREMMPSWIVG